MSYVWQCSEWRCGGRMARGCLPRSLQPIPLQSSYSERVWGMPPRCVCMSKASAEGYRRSDVAWISRVRTTSFKELLLALRRHSVMSRACVAPLWRETGTAGFFNDLIPFIYSVSFFLLFHASAERSSLFVCFDLINISFPHFILFVLAFMFPS